MPNKMIRLIKNFHSSEEATTAVEYAVMLALIATAAMLSISVCATASQAIWNGAADEMGDALGN